MPEVPCVREHVDISSADGLKLINEFYGNSRPNTKHAETQDVNELTRSILHACKTMRRCLDRKEWPCPNTVKALQLIDELAITRYFIYAERIDNALAKEYDGLVAKLNSNVNNFDDASTDGGEQ
jgi:hypothetical protein